MLRARDNAVKAGHERRRAGQAKLHPSAAMRRDTLRHPALRAGYERQPSRRYNAAT